MGSFAINMDHVQSYVMPQLYGLAVNSPGSSTAGALHHTDNHVVSMAGDGPAGAAQKRHLRHTANGAGNNSSAGSSSVNGRGIPGSATSSSMTPSSLAERVREKQERLGLVLWRHPITTLQYCVLEAGHLTTYYLARVWEHKRVVSCVVALLLFYCGVRMIPGPHQQVLSSVSLYWVWCGWWLWLGVLSSVGLGTGLHTFLLYLGPHIASVTMAAYTCNSLDFPEPPYPDEIVCPEEVVGTAGVAAPLTIWTIMSKVRLEAFMWGAGTALGELPPYFMARGARLSGSDPEDEEMAEFEELQRLKERPEDMGWLDRAKLSVEKLVERVGFFGILACASIPNPLFDLAGITCGHFLVPFWTFFGATLIGKAIIKMHIQKLFVIIAFNDALLTSALHLLAGVPVLGPTLQQPFKNFLHSQQVKLKRKPGAQGAEVKDKGSVLSWVFEKFIILMVTYFLVSIVNSLAQNYHKRISKHNVVGATTTTTTPPALAGSSKSSKTKHAKD